MRMRLCSGRPALLSHSTIWPPPNHLVTNAAAGCGWRECSYPRKGWLCMCAKVCRLFTCFAIIGRRAQRFGSHSSLCRMQSTYIHSLLQPVPTALFLYRCSLPLSTHAFRAAMPKLQSCGIRLRCVHVPHTVIRGSI